jgi:hypothetical protein
MRITSIIPAVLLFSIISSCSKSDSSGGGGGTTAEPRAGSTWVYKYTTYNEGGSVLVSVNLTLKATSQTFAGTSWLLLTEQSSGVQFIAIQKRADGWWQIPLPNTTPSLWYKTPGAVNDTYSLTIDDGTVDQAKIISITASAAVPAGSFTGCTQIQSFDPSLENEYYFISSGAIMVRASEFDNKTIGTGKYEAQRWELVSFTP